MKLLTVLEVLFLVSSTLVGISSAWSPAEMARMVSVTKLRLVNGNTVYEGRLEVYHNSRWGTVCDDGFDMNDAKVVCRHLGYGDALGFKGSAHYGQGNKNYPIWIDDSACTGSELTLSECFNNGPGNHNCGHNEDVGVQCKAPIAEGKVRLVGGSNVREGRVEVFHNGRWGTICDDFWDINDAHVVCRQLNYTRALQAKSYAHFGTGPDPIWMDDVHCSGSEKRLVDCKHNGWGSHNCMHTEDAGVVCTSHQPVHGGWSAWRDRGCSKSCGGGIKRKSRTCTNPTPKYGGRSCKGPTYATEQCNTGCCPVNGGWSQWVQDVCDVSCGGGTLTKTRECTNPAPSCGGANCTGLAEYVVPCNTQCCPVDGGWSNWTLTSECTKSCGGGTMVMCRYCDEPAPYCGGQQCSGPSIKTLTCNTQCCRVDGGWTDWCPHECSATCGGGIRNLTRTCTNPTPSCNGSECVGESVTTEKCNMHCCPAQKKAVTLMFHGASEYEGLVRLTTDEGLTGLVCNDKDTWSLTEANIVCMQLFGTTARSTTSTAGPIIWEGPVVRANFSCIGDEDCLSMCSSDEHVGICQNFAAVTCHPPENSVRLADGPNAYTGRVEVYANETWGIVCDDQWDINDGHVVCQQLGFAKATSIHQAAEFGPGNGPILLDDVQCTGREQDLLSCQHNAIGVHNCIPEEAAGVTCGCTYQKPRTIAKTKVISYTASVREWCWTGYCTRYQTAYKQQTYSTDIFTEEPRCCKIDGRWGDWKAAGCSKSCGGGVQILTRSCDSPRAFCRGKQCFGPVTLARHCNTHPCPAVYSKWEPFDECSVTCGGGTQSRNRTCISGSCDPARMLEVRDCNTQCCPVDGGWGNWSSGSCSKPCGGGVLNTSRSCDNPVPSCGGRYCDGIEFEELSCNEELCENTLSEWSEWSECSVPCGDGRKFRNRTCLSSTCTDDLYEVEKCNEMPCEPMYSNWTEASTCSATCGGGRQLFSRNCTSGVCNGTTTQVRLCALVCCPVNGGWSNYTAAGPCSKTCGKGGMVKMMRTCNNPEPFCGGQECMGIMMMMEECDLPDCPTPVENTTDIIDEIDIGTPIVPDTTNDTKTNGTTSVTGSGSEDPVTPDDEFLSIGPWSEYSNCSVACGGGNQTRTRTCTGQGCDNVTTTETIECNAHCCPVDGGWSEYEPETSCSVTCGSGVQCFARNCTNPVPSCGGKMCDGPMMEQRSCDLAPCVDLPNVDLTPAEIAKLFGQFERDGTLGTVN